MQRRNTPSAVDTKDKEALRFKGMRGFLEKVSSVCHDLHVTKLVTIATFKDLRIDVT